MNLNLYRLHEIHEVERGLNEEKLKHSAIIEISLFAKRLHWLLFDFSVFYVSFQPWVFVRF